MFFDMIRLNDVRRRANFEVWTPDPGGTVELQSIFFNGAGVVRQEVLPVCLIETVALTILNRPQGETFLAAEGYVRIQWRVRRLK